MAVVIERAYTKDQILTYYLNQIYLGNGLYGMEQAARGYFKKSAATVSIAEAAWLAALIKKPEGYLELTREPLAVVDDAAPQTPYLQMAQLDSLRHRANLVVERMYQLNWISGEQYGQALDAPARPFSPQRESGTAPYFVQQVIREAKTLFGTPQLEGLGLQLHTTVSVDLQTIAERVVQQVISRHASVGQVALVALDPHSGAVKALIGGADYRNSQFNRATQALRQPGSAFKPILYAAALEQITGLHPGTLFVDEPISYQSEEQKQNASADESQPALPGVYQPLNFNNRYGEPGLALDYLLSPSTKP